MKQLEEGAVALRQPTRDDYIKGRCSHDEYYLAIAKTAGIRYSTDWPLAKRVRKAMAEGDEHLNSIPLATWHVMGTSQRVYGVARAFKLHGDFVSEAGLVCMNKAAAKFAAQDVNGG